MNDSRKMKPAWPPEIFSCSDWPDHWNARPCGSFSAEMASIAGSASPELRPGALTPLICTDG